MLRKTLALVLLLDVTLAFSLSVDDAARRSHIQSRHVVDSRMLASINGTYSDHVGSATCDASPRAIRIQYFHGLMTLQPGASKSWRRVQVDRRPQLIDTRPVRFRNGRGHWDDGNLIVESLSPAAPLWSTQPAPRDSTLRERFSFSPTSLTYRASYRLANDDETTPFEVLLTKCEASHDE